MAELSQLEQDNCISANPYSGGNDITLAGFMFCQHLKEYCHQCPCDHRLTNNMRVEGLEEQDPDAERTPLTLQPHVFTLCADGRTLQCSQHCVTGCRVCFDFEKMIKRQMASASRK